jgi:hypothetical protein
MFDVEAGGELPFLKNGIDQIALVVEDIDKGVEAFWKLFGIGPWHIYTYGRPLVQTMSYRGKPGNFRMRLALSQIGPLGIELIEPLEGDSIYADHIEKHGYGLHHVGVVVDDMEAAIAQAEAAGLAVTQHGAGYGLDGDGQFTYLDTEDQLGMIVELLQLPKRRIQPDKTYPTTADK